MTFGQEIRAIGAAVYTLLHPMAVQPEGVYQLPAIERGPGQAPNVEGPASSPRAVGGTQTAVLQRNIQITSRSSVDATLLVTGIVKQRDGALTAIGPNGQGYTIRIAGDRQTHAGALSIGNDVDLVAINVVATNTVTAFECFVIVQDFVTTPGGVAIVSGTRIQNYATNAMMLTYPGSPVVLSTDGVGRYRAITGTAPALGAEVTESCPSGLRWDLLFANLTLITDAVAGNRFAVMAVQNNGGIGYFTWENITFGASKSPSYIAAQVSQHTAVTTPITAVSLPLPSPMILLGGDRFFTDTENLDAGDRWLAPVYFVREWIDMET